MTKFIGFIIGLIILAGLFRVGMSDVGDTSTLKTYFIPLATFFLDTFNSAATAISLCLAMVAVGAAVTLYFYGRRIRPAQADLKAVARQLRDIDGRSDRAALDAVDRVMTAHGSVSRGWRLYRSTLVMRDDARVASTVTPDGYFNMRMLEGAGVRLRFFLQLPNDFVGLGLVFTFMGLVAGLYFASRSMMSPDLEVARAALVQLLHAATFKFLTSITGIGLSLVLSWIQSIFVGRLNSELHEIQFLIEERFPLNAAYGSIPPAASLRPAPVPAKAPTAVAAPVSMARPV